MIKNYTLAFTGITLFALSSFGQTIVSTKTEPKKAVFEAFTGIHCGYCPDGHRILEAFALKNPGRVVIIGEHSGPLAIPTGSEPDFRTSFAQQLYSFSGVKTLPAGDVNRQLFPGATDEAPYHPQNAPNNLALRRVGYEAAGDDVLKSGNSPVNFGIEAKYDASSQTLNIKVELYFTGSVTGKLNVLIMEHNIIAFQSDYTKGDNPAYEHDHVMRDAVTGQWGESVSSATKFQTKTYAYKMNSKWVPSNCSVVAFISKTDNKNIYSGAEAAVTSTVGIAENTGKVLNVQVAPNPINEFSTISFNNNNDDVSIILYNILGEAVSKKPMNGLSIGLITLPFNSFINEGIKPGIYLLKVKTGNLEETKKIIIN